jgi:integrase
MFMFNYCISNAYEGQDMRGDGELTIAKIEAAVPIGGKPLMLYDGGGLCLRAWPNKNGGVSRRWFYKYPAFTTVVSASGKARRKRNVMSLGAYPRIDLVEARKLARKNAVLVAEGTDPKDERARKRASQRPSKPPPTFRAVATEYLAAHEAEWTHVGYALSVGQSLRDHVFPVRLNGRTFADTPVDEIDTAAVRAVLDPMWKKGGKAPTADKVRGRIEAVLGYAGVNGWRGDPPPQNPAAFKGHLEHVYAPVTKIAPPRKQANVAPSHIAAFMATLRTIHTPAARALEFLILTVVRTDSILNATWSQIDWNGRVWSIPDTKTGTVEEAMPQWVPLTQAMKDCLLAVNPRDGDLPLDDTRIFAIGRNDMHALCKRICRDIGIPHGVPHGMRHCFKTWSGHAKDIDRTLVEAALSHHVDTAVARRYDERVFHRNLLDQRRPIMERWSAFVSTPYSDNVIPLRAVS